MGRPTVSKQQRRETQQRAQNTNQDRLHRAHNAEVTEDATHEVKKLDPVNIILRPLASKPPLNFVSSSTPVPNFSTSTANSPHSFISSNSPSNVTSPTPPLNSSFPTPPPEPHNITSTNFPPPPHPLPQIHSPTTFVPREEVLNTKADQDRERKLAANRERQRLYRARAKEKKKQQLLEEKERERRVDANKSIACSHCGDDDEFGKSEETTHEVEWANVIDGLMAMVTFFIMVICVPVGLALWTIWGWRWKVVPGIGGMYLRSSA